MTPVTDIIKDAYRESNLLAISATPTDLEQEEALRLLNRFVLSVIGNEAGDPLNSFPLGRQNIGSPSGFPYYENLPYEPDWFVPLNTRLALNLSAPVTVFLHPVPQDGSRFAFNDLAGNLSTNSMTVEGNGRLIEGQLSVVMDQDGDEREYIFRADTGNWQKVSPLLLTDEMPFPADFDDFFIIGLAMRLNPRNSISISPESASAFQKAARSFKARYHQVIQMPSELALLMTPGSLRYRGIGLNTQYANAFFNSGYAFPFGYSFF